MRELTIRILMEPRWLEGNHGNRLLKISHRFKFAREKEKGRLKVIGALWSLVRYATVFEQQLEKEL
jgi:hypothetical protein